MVKQKGGVSSEKQTTTITDIPDYLLESIFKKMLIKDNKPFNPIDLQQIELLNNKTLNSAAINYYKNIKKQAIQKLIDVMNNIDFILIYFFKNTILHSNHISTLEIKLKFINNPTQILIEKPSNNYIIKMNYNTPQIREQVIMYINTQESLNDVMYQIKHFLSNKNTIFELDSIHLDECVIQFQRLCCEIKYKNNTFEIQIKKSKRQVLKHSSVNIQDIIDFVNAITYTENEDDRFFEDIMNQMYSFGEILQSIKYILKVIQLITIIHIKRTKEELQENRRIFKSILTN